MTEQHTTPGIAERGVVPDQTGKPEYPLSLDLLFAVSVILTAAGAAMMLAATAVYVRLLLT